MHRIGRKIPLVYEGLNEAHMNLNLKQEGHRGPELLTCTIRTSHICLCDPLGGQLWPQGHYLNKLGSGPLGDATYQISRF